MAIFWIVKSNILGQGWNAPWGEEGNVTWHLVHICSFPGPWEVLNYAINLNNHNSFLLGGAFSPCYRFRSWDGGSPGICPVSHRVRCCSYEGSAPRGQAPLVLVHPWGLQALRPALLWCTYWIWWMNGRDLQLCKVAPYFLVIEPLWKDQF